MKAQNELQGEETIANAITLDILNSNFKLPPMPANGSKLMALIQQPIDKIDIDSFAKLIDSDPGLFSMILQLANSIYFKGIDEIFSLRAAITRVGLQETINFVNLYFFQRILPKIPEIEGFSTKDYWAFSWACATAARRLGHPNLNMKALPGELYIAGLLHGIGKLIFAIHYPVEFSKCIQKAAELKQPLHTIELDEFGTTDTLIASKLMTIWNIPSRIRAGVEFYQDPGSAPEKCRDIAALLQSAYSIAAMSGIGINGDGGVLTLESTWIAGQSGVLLSKKRIRDNIVQEILESLEKKSESITGVIPPKRDVLPDSKIPVDNHKNSSVRTQPKTDNKGLLAWIKSLFG
ncbi:HDOD domain-containing protein [Desulfobacula phenolica]|uniref:HD-like signal output (HDOD) domain, no enzymatic activity n=1 Tax=Desulfobacula phenolica TaxID=90732 RepID=A0A1H2GLI7_9BACT|nr:HDOD domain-containing protein [Desulfobacula phenolica]SDU20384.1 HD-like signal output (HDOD) domain, no enzymatic activity [Desulfobacula phenolica]